MLPLMLLVALMEPPQAGGRASAPYERQAEPVEFRMVLSAPVYQPDGAVSSETITLPNGTTNGAPSVSYIYSRQSVCETASRTSSEPTDASFGWRLMSQTISQTPTELVVGVDWRRMWDRGRRLTNGPSGTVHLTLHPGDRIPLDHIPNPAMNDACHAVGLGLEVRLARTTVNVPAPPANLVPLGAVSGGVSALDADLWLADSQPTGAMKVTHQIVRVPKAGGTFAFDAVTLSTPLGQVGVEFTGALSRFQVSTTGESLLLTLTRVITGSSAPPGGYRGSSVTPISLPGPAEVLSFEMPGSLTPTAAARGGIVSAVRGGARGGAGGGGSGAVVAVGSGGGGGLASGTSARPVPSGNVIARQPSGAAGGAVIGEVPQNSGPQSMMRSAYPAAKTLLDGHTFELRVRLTPVAGS